MKYYLKIAANFCREYGRQIDMLYTGIGAPFTGPHFWKTRCGIKSAFIFAKLMADIEFSKPPFDV